MRRRGRVAIRGLSLLLTLGFLAVLIWVSRRAPAPSPPPAASAAPGPRATRPPDAARPKAIAERRPATAPRGGAPPADFEAADDRGGGLLALVLDDMGYDAAALRQLAAFQGPLALSVIPSAPHADEAAALALRKGWDLMIHLPMAPETGRAERGAFGPEDPDVVIAARVEEALERLPGALGLNNHQGSRATADARVVRTMLSVLKSRGLFFLDSRTSPATVAEREARAMGIPASARDVFLDDAATEAASPGGAPEALEEAWRKALDTVARKGTCVVIGHPHRSTLDFLAARLPALRAADIRQVRVSELVD